MCHVDYSHDWEKSPRFMFKSKTGRKSLKQHKRHERRNRDMSRLSFDEAFELTHCQAKSVFQSMGDACVGGLRASHKIGPNRPYYCPICGKYHLTTSIEEAA